MRVPQLVVTAVALIIGVAVPVLEFNATHVFNAAWPGHARLHEVWQLAGNTALAGLCLWLAWRKGAPRLAAGIGLCLTGGFMVAYALSGAYGGSMLHTDGTELAIGGVNVAVIVMLAATCALAAVVCWPQRETAAS
jgi:hypothetical protein